ncbi:MAG TPA: hypothetical protein VNI60_05605 [Pyrinomonadaceae bacterium]|nr:hypothetical protein [Pyrinomonadaceae bacterium]
MSSSKNENVERIVWRTKISGGKITNEREIFPRTKKKAPVLRTVLV